MILSDRELEYHLLQGTFVVKPMKWPIQPASIDLSLGDMELRPVARTIDLAILSTLPDDPPIQQFTSLILLPNDFVSVMTEEFIGLPNHLVGIVQGKSRYARYGLQIESAGYVDPGWEGHLTLELKNLGPHTLILDPGMKICQLRIEQLSTPATRRYGELGLGSHYQGATEPQMRGRADE